MKLQSILVCIAALATLHSANAEQVNQCTDASGRTVLTDRPCGNPSVERAAQRPPPQAMVEQIQAEDIFSARKKIRETSMPMPSRPTDGADRPIEPRGNVY